MLDMNRIRLVMDNVEGLTDSFQVGYVDTVAYLIDSANNVHGPYKEIKAVTPDVALCIGEMQAQIFVDALGNKTRDIHVYKRMLTNSILKEMVNIENDKEFKALLTEVREEEKAIQPEDGYRITDFEVAHSTNLVQYNLLHLCDYAMLAACINLPGRNSTYNSLFLIKNITTGEIIKDIFCGSIQSLEDTFIIEDADDGTLELLDSHLQVAIHTDINTNLKSAISNTVFIANEHGTNKANYILKAFNGETLKIGTYSDEFEFRGINYTVEGQNTKENTVQIPKKDMQIIIRVDVLDLKHSSVGLFRLYKTILDDIHVIICKSHAEIALIDVSYTEDGLLDAKKLEHTTRILCGGNGVATSANYSE